MAPFADTLRGGVHALRGQLAAAAERLEDAALGFDEWQMTIHASAARHQAACLRGEDGARSRRDELAWMASRGVVDAARMARALVPAPEPVC